MPATNCSNSLRFLSSAPSSLHRRPPPPPAFVWRIVSEPTISVFFFRQPKARPRITIHTSLRASDPL